MEIDIRSLVGLGGIPLIQALVAVVKTAFPAFPARYYPGLSVTFGVLANLGLAYLLGSDLQISVAVGVTAGLAASGLFDYGKRRELENTGGA